MDVKNMTDEEEDMEVDDEDDDIVTRRLETNDNGDCFYEAIVEAFRMDGVDIQDHCPLTSSPTFTGVKALRLSVSQAVTQEVFENFKLFNEAGLSDYSFMKRVNSMSKLKEVLAITGAEAGPKNCIWANDWEINTVTQILGITCLIIDLDSRMESRFVKVGSSTEKFVILEKQRSHYSLYYKQQAGSRKGVQELADLTQEAKVYWKLPKH